MPATLLSLALSPGILAAEAVEGEKKGLEDEASYRICML
jgi:hypothetical protein